MSGTPKKNVGTPSTRRSTRKLDVDETNTNSSIPAHMRSPAPKSVATPQSPAFATRSRLTIRDKVTTLSFGLDDLLKKTPRGSSQQRHQRAPVVLPSPRVRGIGENQELNPIVLLKKLPESRTQDVAKTPKSRRSLDAATACKALVDETIVSAKKVKASKSRNNSQSADLEDSDSFMSPRNRTKNSSDDDDFFSAEETDMHSAGRARKKTRGDDSQVLDKTLSPKKRKSKAKTPLSPKKEPLVAESETDAGTPSVKKMTSVDVAKSSSPKKKLVIQNDSPAQTRRKTSKKSMKNLDSSDLESSENAEADKHNSVKTPSSQKSEKLDSPNKNRSPSKSLAKVEVSKMFALDSTSDDSDAVQKTPTPKEKKRLSLQKEAKSPLRKKFDLDFSTDESDEKKKSPSPKKSNSPTKVRSPQKAIVKNAEEEDAEDENESTGDQEMAEEPEDNDSEDEAVEDDTDFTFGNLSRGEEMGDVKPESDEESDEAPEEVSMVASKKAVHQMMRQEVEAIQQLSLEKKEKLQKRAEKMKEEKKQKKKSGDKIGIELLPETVIEQLQNIDKDVAVGEEKKKKKRSRKRKNKEAEADEESVQPKKKYFGDDYIPLNVDGPTEFGLVPLNESSSFDAQKKSKWNHRYKLDKIKRMNRKNHKKALAKQKARPHGVPLGFKGDQHFY